MPTYQEWIREIDINIDYFSAFIKAWIAFNAWYRHEFPDLHNDRKVIEAIKTTTNHFKGNIETLLDKTNGHEDAIRFRENLDKLQQTLTNTSITTQERGGHQQQISFSEIAIVNQKTLSDENYRNTHYRIERKGEKVTTHICKKSSETEVYFHFEQETYDELALDAHPTFLHLSEQRRMQCKAFYKEICPYVTESILTRDRENKIVFIEERAKVSRGIIEVLYLLRCSLMHGEVSPNDHTNEVYKYAYNILAAVLKRLA